MELSRAEYLPARRARVITANAPVRRVATGDCRDSFRREHLFPIVLHVDDGPAALRRLRRAPCRACRRATCGRRRTRARRRCGGRSGRSAGPRRAVVHCSICRSPSELPNAMIGPAADEPVDADRLAGAVVDENDLGLLDQDRLAVAHLELRSRRCCRRPAPAGCRRSRSAKARMNSTPPPETMNVLKPFARRYASTSSIGW